MSSTASPTPSADSAQPSKSPSVPAVEPKPLREMIFSSTPIVLTVVSTLLAGASTQEMNYAQYNRSQAAEQQARASDQWNFYQAKHIRETIHLAGYDELRIQYAPEQIGPERLPTALTELRALTEQLAGLAEDRSRTATADVTLTQLAGDARAAAEEFAAADDQLRELLKPTVGGALPVTRSRLLSFIARAEYPDYVNGRIQDERLQGILLKLRAERLAQRRRSIDETAIEDAAIQLAMADAAPGRRRVGEEARSRVASLDADRLGDAVETAEAEADAIEGLAKPLERQLDELSERLRTLVTAAQRLRRAAATAARESPTRPSSPALAAISASADRLAEGTQRLAGDFVAARRGFTTWRYMLESQANLRVAELLEVQVRIAGHEADRRMSRCWGYFYAMMLAQTAVVMSAVVLMSPRYQWTLWAASVAVLLTATVQALLVTLDLPALIS